jgi:AraC-like DNA-binding protein
LQFQRYAIPELAARASATLREALQQWARFATLVHPAVAFGFEEAEGLTHFSHRTLGYPRGLSRHLNEFALAAAVYFSRQTSGSGPRVLEVHFVHPRPQSLDRLQTFFRTSALYFGAAENRLVIDSESLAGVQATADARLLATAQALGQSSLTELTPEDSSIRATVAERLQQQLDRGEIRIRKLARELHMSVRSLQRRLAEADTTFALLLDEVRHQLACKLVAETETPLSDVALRVGFAEFATFSRAFKRWTGSSPGAFRAARR